MATITITRDELTRPLAYISNELFRRLARAFDKPLDGLGAEFLNMHCELPLKEFLCTGIDTLNMNIIFI